MSADRKAWLLKLPKRLAAPDDLAAEPEDVKGVRMLRTFRYMIERKRRILGFTLDGQRFLLIQWQAGVDPPEALETPPEMTL